MQLQGQYQDAQRQLQIVSQQTQSREREKKLSTLTLREIESLSQEGSTLYRGVGRMSVGLLLTRGGPCGGSCQC